MITYLAVCRQMAKDFPVLAQGISGYRITIVSTLRRAIRRNKWYQDHGMQKRDNPIVATASGR